MARSTFVYVTYIRTTPEKLWSALTDDVEFMKQYWFGTRCESQWTPGSSWQHVSGDGQLLLLTGSQPALPDRIVITVLDLDPGAVADATQGQLVHRRRSE